jgi:hypothetical protein
MLQSFTIDVIADETAHDLLAGTPSPSLLHRFLRKGQRDGKRQLDHSSVATLIQSAVGLAGTTLCLEYLGCRDRAAEEVAQLRAKLEGRLMPSADADPESTVDVEGPSAEAGPELDRDRSTTLHPNDGDEALHNALLRRRRRNAERETAVRLRSLDQARGLQRGDVKKAQSEAGELRSQLADKVAVPEQLREEYLERFLRISEAGGLLWARYRTGYEQGYKRRRSNGSGVQPPHEVLRFEIPGLLEVQAGAPPMLPIPTTALAEG